MTEYYIQIFQNKYFVIDKELDLIEGEFDTIQEARQLSAELNGTTYNGFNVREELQYKPIEEIKKIQKDSSFPFAVAALNVDGDLNIGTLIRSAVIFGAERFFIFGRRKYDKRSTVGAHNYIDIIHIEWDQDNDPAENVDEIIRSYGYTMVALEQGGTPLNEFGGAYEGNHCIILGSESDGVPQSLLDLCDVTYEIEQFGVLRSLNVSVAGSIIMREFANKYIK